MVCCLFGHYFVSCDKIFKSVDVNGYRIGRGSHRIIKIGLLGPQFYPWIPRQGRVIFPLLSCWMFVEVLSIVQFECPNMLISPVETSVVFDFFFLLSFPIARQGGPLFSVWTKKRASFGTVFPVLMVLKVKTFCVGCGSVWDWSWTKLSSGTPVCFTGWVALGRTNLNLAGGCYYSDLEEKPLHLSNVQRGCWFEVRSWSSSKVFC